MANQYGRDIAKFEVLSPEEELKLFRQCQAGDMLAQKQLIDSQLKLILNICGKHKSKEYHDDLVQLCNIALLRRFSKEKKDSKLQKFDPDYLRKKKNVDKTMRLSYFTRQICRSTISRFFKNRKDTVDHNVPLEECVGVPESIEILVHNKINGQTMRQLLDGLPARERKILAGLFGIKCKKYTLKDLSCRFKISITRVWEIKQEAMGKLRLILCSMPEMR